MRPLCSSSSEIRFSSMPEPLSTSTPKWVLTSSSWRAAFGLVGGAERVWWRDNLMVTGGKAHVAGPSHVRRDRDVSLGAAVSIISGAS